MDRVKDYDEELARARRAYNVARSMGYKGGPPKILVDLEQRAMAAMADEIAKMETPRRSED